MKLKFLSLICAVGLFAFGTNTMAQDAKMEAPAAPAKEASVSKTKMKETSGIMPLVHPNLFCNPSTNTPPSNPYCTPGNPQYSSIKCDAICAGYKKAHEFITGELCSDPAVTPKAPKKPYSSCAKLCAPTGATLNDLSCCLTQVGDNLSMTTKAKLYGVCNAAFGTADCPFAPIANYAGWLCCPREASNIANCLKSANQNPAWTCATTFAPQNCPPASK